MLILSIVTFFIYETYWFATQRKHLVKKTGVKIPSAWWIVVATAGAWLSVIGLIIAILVNINALLVSSIVFGVLIVSFSIIRIVWVWHFLIGAAKIVSPRVTLGWLLVHLFLIGVSVIFILQYYFNRKPNPKQKNPSTKFVVLSLVAIIAIQGISGVAYFYNEYPQLEKSVMQSQEVIELGKQTELLDKKYQACTQQLDSDFPVVTEENEPDYLQGWDDCDAIRIEQNKAVDAYNAASRNL